MARRWIGLGTAAAMAVLALLIACWILTPPRPLPADTAPERFAADRAMADVAAIATAPHPAGSAADEAVARYLAGRLTAMGMRVGLDRAPFDAAMRRRMARLGAPVAADARVVSVVGLLPGRDRGAPALVLMAHHDSVPGSPGAADDAIGVAAILEIVRALQAGSPPERDLLVLFTGGEETGLVGARHLFARAAMAGHVGVIVNFEARGGGGRAVMFETGAGNGAMMRRFLQAVPAPSAMSLAVSVYRRMPNATDLTPAIERGYFGFNFAIADRAFLYHSPLSTPDRLSRASLQDMGDQGFGLARMLLHLPVLPPRTPDKVFDVLLGSKLILYPTAAGWLLLGLCAWGLVDTSRRLTRGGVSTIDETLPNLALPLLLLFGGSAALFAVDRLSGNDGHADYYDRLAALPRLEAQAGLLCLALLLALAAVARFTRWGGWLALFATTALLGLGVQIWLPTAATPLHWPLLVAALQMVIAARVDPTLEAPEALVPIGLLAALGTAQALATAHGLFLLVGASLAPVALAALLPAALLFWPLLAGRLGGRTAPVVVVLLALAALALALWVRCDPVAPGIPTYGSDKP